VAIIKERTGIVTSDELDRMVRMNQQAEQSLNKDVRTRWDTNAAFWDERMGEGNDYHRFLVEPAMLKLLELQPGQRVLEIACGNGQFSRKLASLGARLLATDFSPNMVERARAHSEAFNDQVDYRVVDATSREQLRALGENEFNAVVSNMALMDMAEIEPLFRAVPALLKRDGRFVFTTMHPCFNSNNPTIVAEVEDREGTIVETRAVKLSQYLTPATYQGLAIIGQPVSQYYFHRPLHELFGAAFRAGMVLDGLEEPQFPPTASGARWFSWTNLHEIPPVLAARFRVSQLTIPG
jgi:2-polyprenyl-3-methyl-5-hydroxy-6-metoxy-1,4-benzoquinol methylase